MTTDQTMDNRFGILRLAPTENKIKTLMQMISDIPHYRVQVIRSGKMK